MIVNVAFNISDPLRSDLIKTSLEIKSDYKTSFWIDDKQYYLHLPMYLFVCPENNREKIITASKEYVKSLSPVGLEVTDLTVEKNGLVMVKFARSDKLYDFHLKALELFNPIRENTQRHKYADDEYVKTLPKDDQDKIREYGHIWILDKFDAHVTVAKINDLNIAEEIIQKYEEDLVGRKAILEKLQVHEAIYGKDDRTEILVSLRL